MTTITKQRTAANKLTEEIKGIIKMLNQKKKKGNGGQNTHRTNGRKTVKSSQSIITLNVNGIKHPQLNTEFSSWMKRQAPCLQEHNYNDTNTHMLRRWKGYTTLTLTKENWNACVSSKVDFWTKFVTRMKECYFIVVKGSVLYKDVRTLTFMHLITEFQNTGTKPDKVTNHIQTLQHPSFSNCQNK